MSDTLTIPAKDGSGRFAAYVAMPEKTPAPAIVAIQEIFGINAGMRRICDDLAAQGYIAWAPDLFWRIQPGIDLTDQTEAEWQQAFDLFNKFDADKGIEDIAATIVAARRHPKSNGRVGAVGYCLGGLLAYLTAARTDVDASVGYYGVGIHERLGEKDAIGRPLLLHIAEEDGFVDKDAQKQMHDALDPHPLVTLHDYPGVDHAFARPDGTTRNENAAKLADQRTIDFFAEHLR
ncbi:carboxymethylenebutenolidase [Rhodothalassium salexigens]|uniref:dienelactone hydrolase family protein n=1 Tax=Rhodothalassium salexigens TaxID=1086 RepID=UPI001912329B|nr:dienelactone hydrolase family protein [Rhodothalassium salexigens]MBK5911534.1 carboxymethylenebutenolidase [Rhodothalassium salexigens]